MCHSSGKSLLRLDGVSKASMLALFWDAVNVGMWECIGEHACDAALKSSQCYDTVTETGYMRAERTMLVLYSNLFR